MDAIIFIPLMILAVTQIIKMLSPKITGLLTIVVAILVGIVVAVVDTQIGVMDITIANGIVLALGAVGISTVADRV